MESNDINIMRDYFKKTSWMWIERLYSLTAYGFVDNAQVNCMTGDYILSLYEVINKEDYLEVRKKDKGIQIRLNVGDRPITDWVDGDIIYSLNLFPDTQLFVRFHKYLNKERYNNTTELKLTTRNTMTVDTPVEKSNSLVHNLILAITTAVILTVWTIIITL